jgi:DNA repair protein RecN (Recombination protein N)
MAIDLGERASIKELDFLTFQVQEIEALSPKRGELVQLESRFTLLTEAGTWREAAARVADELAEGDTALLPRLGRLLRRLEGAPDPRLAGAADALRQALEPLREAAQACAGAADGITADPAELARVEERLNRLNGLMRKHGEGEDALFAAWEDLAARARELTGLDERRETLRADLARLTAERATAGTKLATARAKAFKKLAAEVHAHLADLGMPKAQISLSEETGEPTALGTVQQSFAVCTNPGSRPGSLRDIASGGEAARLMLALSAALAAVDPVPVVIYDEVDSGVGGRLGAVIGGKLAQVARGRSVLAVTHTPQLAACGQRHFQVRKIQGEGETQVHVTALEGTTRLAEVADMLGGGAPAMAQARSLLAGGGA